MGDGERCREGAGSGRAGNGGLHASPRQWHRPDAARVAGAEPEDRIRAQQSWWGTFSGNVDQATYSPIASAPTRVSALLSKELDLITDLPLQDIERVKSTPGFSVLQAPQQLFMELEMDGTRDVALDVFDKAGQPLKANPLQGCARAPGFRSRD